MGTSTDGTFYSIDPQPEFSVRSLYLSLIASMMDETPAFTTCAGQVMKIHSGNDVIICLLRDIACIFNVYRYHGVINRSIGAVELCPMLGLERGVEDI